MKTLVVGFIVVVVLGGGAVAGIWAALRFNPGSVGTPVNAGAISEGRPEQCTNVNFVVRPRSQEVRTVLLPKNTIVRGTFEVQGGLGRVDIFLRVQDPQNQDILASPKEETYDFTFPVRIDGEYRFIFDNRYSMYTSKSVGFYYCLDDGRGSGG